MALVRATKEATIDVVLVTLTTTETTPKEFALDTADNIGVTPQTETSDAVRLIIKDKLIAQKPQKTIVVGNTIVLRDNVFTPEVVQILQGGTIEYDLVDTDKIIGYTPKTVGEDQGGLIFTLSAYSAVYDTSGTILKYEKITYPNCQGNPVSLSSEDGSFRVNEYTINSYPASTEAPYALEYIAALPAIT